MAEIKAAASGVSVATVDVPSGGDSNTNALIEK